MNDDTFIQNLTAQVVEAYVANNSVPPEGLAELVIKVREAFSTASVPDAPAVADKPVPAVPPKKSVFPDYIICLEDGKKLKLLRRHLKSAYNMTPEQYRERWDLPAEYPMVAPNYAKHRSSLARQIGLGQRREFADE